MYYLGTLFVSGIYVQIPCIKEIMTIIIIIICINYNNNVFPRDIVCFRHICINTLHKGDNDNDDDDIFNCK
jgi:hypothetical protein